MTRSFKSLNRRNRSEPNINFGKLGFIIEELVKLKKNRWFFDLEVPNCILFLLTVFTSRGLNLTNQPSKCNLNHTEPYLHVEKQEKDLSYGKVGTRQLKVLHLEVPFILPNEIVNNTFNLLKFVDNDRELKYIDAYKII